MDLPTQCNNLFHILTVEFIIIIVIKFITFELSDHIFRVDCIECNFGNILLYA